MSREVPVRFCEGLGVRLPRPTHPYIKVRGKWNFLYRAVDKHGKTVDFLLRPDRGIAAAQAFFRKALATSLPRWPRKITLDGHKQSHLALRYLRREDPKWKYVQVRSSQYLNNLIEQNHRAIKRRCASMGGFKSFGSAAITLAGIELAHRIRKKQFSLGRGRYLNFGSPRQNLGPSGFLLVRRPCTGSTLGAGNGHSLLNTVCRHPGAEDCIAIANHQNACPTVPHG